MPSPEEEITLTTRGKIAIITLNREKKLNALDSDLYYRLAMLMNEVAAKPEITVTVLTGNGRFFSAYVYSFRIYLFHIPSLVSTLYEVTNKFDSTEAQT
jgi:hypothetical protein